jgi:hypothetical protein
MIVVRWLGVCPALLFPQPVIRLRLGCARLSAFLLHLLCFSLCVSLLLSFVMSVVVS